MNVANSPSDEELLIKKFGNRHVQMIFLFLVCSLCMAQRTNLSIAIVAMTGKNSTSANPDVPIYNWDKVSIIVGGFFYGYLVLQIPSGFIAKFYSSKHLLLWSFFINTVAFILIPVIADVGGADAVIVMRFIQGLGQGCLFPCAQTILGRWSPPSERSTFGGIVFSGINVGSVVSFFTTGFICASWQGWPYSFYLWGLLGLVWCLLYFFFGFSKPADNPRINPEELDYIQRTLHQTAADKEPKLPFKQIMLSVPFWATASANIGNSFAYTTMMTQVSIYLANVMKFKIGANGMVSACPYIAASIMGWVYSPISDCLIQKHILRRVNARRFFQCFGAYGMGISLIMVGYFSNTQFLAVFLLTLANMFYAATLCAYSLSQVDLSPKFCGIMYGISNSLSFVVGMFSTVLVYYIVTDDENRHQWQIVFIITAVIYIASATIYAIFVTADRQPWDSAPEDLPTTPTT
ncbi:putative inorganic phosphate cotransporter [Anthonomus grandis grandis]|uniref:putative inorganic phosphate cotransporter n=1 Tax=Anthonomus grandis grandis TaxID=2921223 RepID=UPI0021663AB8|nr:putative inorganic phosphate cotransporter [Anthonomus grandis grandis]